LFIDSASLQKRLLIVQAEVDRVRQDNQGLQAEVDGISSRNRELEVLIGARDHKVDMKTAELE
jgi:hypothetical protein